MDVLDDALDVVSKIGKKLAKILSKCQSDATVPGQDFDAYTYCTSSWSIKGPEQSKAVDATATKGHDERYQRHESCLFKYCLHQVSDHLKVNLLSLSLSFTHSLGVAKDYTNMYLTLSIQQNSLTIYSRPCLGQIAN